MRTTRSALTLAATALTTAPALAQNPAIGGSQQQVSDCLMPVPGAADLVGCGLGFNSLGEITFTVKNRGSVGVNVAERAVGTVARTAPVADPSKKIRMDLYLDDKLIQSVYQPALGGNSSREFVAKIPSNYPTPRCGETHSLKLVIDPQHLFAEASEDNNTGTRNADRPCPDMEVESIKANYNDLRTEFVAEIRIANKGNATARFRYLALTSNSAAFGPLPSADFDKLMEIEPGQSKKFTIGNTWSSGSMYVRVFLDRFNEVAELNEGNNFKEKTLP